MKRLITKAFVETIKEFKDEFKTCRATAKHLGVSNMQISRWCNGIGDVITGETFNKIFPKIENRYKINKEKYKEEPLFSNNLVEKNDYLTLELLESWKSLSKNDKLEALGFIERLKKGGSQDSTSEELQADRKTA